MNTFIKYQIFYLIKDFNNLLLYIIFKSCIFNKYNIITRIKILLYLNFYYV